MKPTFYRRDGVIIPRRNTLRMNRSSLKRRKIVEGGRFLRERGHVVNRRQGT